MHRVRNSSWNPTLFVLPNKNYLIWERGRERYTEERDWWNPIYKPMLRNPPLLRVALCLFFFFLFFLSLLCVCNCSLFVFPLLPFFFNLCMPLSIYREIPKKLFPYFSLNWSDDGAVFVSFSSIPPNFMLSRHPLFSFFLFYLFRCFLSSFFLVVTAPLFDFWGLISSNHVPYFLVMPLPYSLFSFFILFYFTWFVYISSFS